MTSSAQPTTPAGVRVLRTQLTSRVAWRLLLFELNRLCADRDIHHRDVARRIGVSRASVSQALKGPNFFSRPAIEIIANFLDARHLLPYWLHLYDLARTGSRDSAPSAGTWDPDLELALEAVAATITIVDFTAIPAALRTKPYAEHLRHHDWHPAEPLPHAANPAETDDLGRRQQILTAEPAARLTWFTDEFAVRRLATTAPESVIRQQLHRLLRLAGSLVDLRIVPATHSPPAPPPTFSLIRLDDGHTSTHERTITATHSTHTPEQHAIHLHIVDKLDRIALDPPESCRLLQDVITSSAPMASTA